MTKNGILNKSWLFKHNCDFSKDVSTSVCDKGFTFLIRREINSLSELCRSFFHPNFLDLHVHASIMNHIVVAKGTTKKVEIPACIQFLGEPKDSIKLSVDRAPSGQYKIKYIKKPTYDWRVFTHFNEGENEITKALEVLFNSRSDSDFYQHAQTSLQSKPASPNQKPLQLFD